MQAEGVGFRGRVLLELRTEAEDEQQVAGRLVAPPVAPTLGDADVRDVHRANVRAEPNIEIRCVLHNCTFACTFHLCAVLWTRSGS